MLKDIFGGPDGAAALVVELLGGVAGIEILQGTPSASGNRAPQYKTTRVSYAMLDEGKSDGAAKTPGGKSWDTNAPSNGLRRVSGRFTCVVPSSRLESAPRPGLDLFFLDGRDYRIEQVDLIRAQDCVVMYRLTCANA